MGAVGTVVNQIESWRNEDPKYQKKTEGGVYFWNSPNSVYGKVIDENVYNKLPKYIQKSIVAADSKKTMDGIHADIYYVNNEGKIEYYDEYGMTDFIYGLKHTFGGKSTYGDVNDWVYDGDYKEGKQLKRK